MAAAPRAVRALVLSLLAPITLAIAPETATAQFNVMSPLFRDLNGGAVWGSAGFATRSHTGTTDERSIWRIGGALFYGPFGGGGDTSVVYTYAVIDTTDTTRVQPDGTRVHQRTREATEHRSESKRLGRDGKVTLAGGYQHSAYYRMPGTPLPPTVALGGLYLGAFLGPYDTPFAPKRLKWYGGLAGTIVQLKNVAGRVDTLGIQLTTERTLAPEFYLMFGYFVSTNYRILLSGSYQFVRFGSVAYEAVEANRLIPGAVLSGLPDEIRLESWHVTLGVSFAASSLVPSR